MEGLEHTSEEEIKKGEVIYRDDIEVLCRAWNYRECDKSKITPNTKTVCLVVEGLEHTSEEEIHIGLSRLKELLTPLCKGAFQEFLLNKNNLEAIF